MNRHKQPTETSFFDVLLSTLGVFIILFALAFILMNPPEQEEEKINTRGEFVVVVNWPDESNDDVDTYVMDPNDNVVYFGSREMGLMHLERDDLGRRNDTTINADGEMVVVEENEERVIIRGIVPGEYIVNVHMYSKRNAEPTPVRVALIRLGGRANIEIEAREVVLEFNGDEKTIFRFTINVDKSITNVNDLPHRFTGPGATR